MIKMVRKISAFALALLFLGVSTGFSVNMHFCKNKLADISFLSEELSCGINDACQSSHCEMMNKLKPSHCEMDNSHCCSNKHLVIKLDSKKIVSQNLTYPRSPKAAVIDLFIIDSPQEAASKEKKSFVDFLPNSCHPPSFILFHQLLFYH